MVRTDPGALRDTTVAWIDRRGNPPSGSLAMAYQTVQVPIQLRPGRPAVR
jgi:hypothetical protein